MAQTRGRILRGWEPPAPQSVHLYCSTSSPGTQVLTPVSGGSAGGGGEKGPKGDKAAPLSVIGGYYCRPGHLLQRFTWACQGELLPRMGAGTGRNYGNRSTNLQLKHKLESRLLGEISTTSDTQITPPLWQKVKRN